MREVRRFVLVLSALIFLCSCGPPPQGDGKIVILSYNVQNLFDAEHNGSEYEEFLPQNGWSERTYHLRLEKLGEVIRKTSPPPDVVVLQEIENENVLDDLCSIYLPEYRYAHRIAGGPRSSATQVGLMTHLPLSRVHRHAPARTDHPLRNILEARLTLPEGELLIIINHWKSRCGSSDEGAGLRVATSRLLRLRLDAICADGRGRRVVIAGDFNCEPRRRTDSTEHPFVLDEECSSLLPVTERLGAALSAGRGRRTSLFPLFSPWGVATEEGSYCYDGRWERIDAFYLSPSLLGEEGLRFDSFRVHPWGELRLGNGSPKRWISEMESGFSDHLPIVLVLTDG